LNAIIKYYSEALKEMVVNMLDSQLNG